MNNIGFGIFCFGEDYYYRGAVDKIKHILNNGFHCYILTENPDYFNQHFSSMYLHIIQYDRYYKSYADKMILPKYILKQHDITILIDADIHIVDYNIFHELKDYQFKNGISYVDTLENHPAKRKYVKELLETRNDEWFSYNKYASTIYPNYGEFETMWEYFLVINKIGFNQDNFYREYEKLQIAKEYSDLSMKKDINGAGEGISIAISAKISNSDLQRDMVLYEKIKDSMVSISRRYTIPTLWPEWMR